MPIKKKTFLLIFVAIVIFETLFFSVQQFIVYRVYHPGAGGGKAESDRAILAIKMKSSTWNRFVTIGLPRRRAQFVGDKNQEFIDNNWVLRRLPAWSECHVVL
jgi:hypothetical protein